MRLFRVNFKDNIMLPFLVRGLTKSRVSLDMKDKYNQLFVDVDYISPEDAEAQFGYFSLFKNAVQNETADTKTVIIVNELKDFYKLAEVAGPENCWDGYKKAGTQKGTGKNKGKRVNKCVPEDIELEQGFRISPVDGNNKYTTQQSRTAAMNKHDYKLNEFAEFITPDSNLSEEMDFVSEEMYFKVNVTGLPDMYMIASSAGMVKAKLRKMLKNMDLIGDIVKTPKAEVRKAFRMKAMTGEDAESTDESADDILKEISVKLAHRYMDKADQKEAVVKTGYGIRNKVSDMPGVDYSWRDKYKGGIASKDAVKKANARSDAKRAEYRKSIGMKEELVSELSKKTMANYTKKASSHRWASGYVMGAADANNSGKGASYKNANDRDVKREKGINLATKKLGEDKPESAIDELSKDTLQNYHKKAQDGMVGAFKTNNPEIKKKFGKRLTGSGKAYQKLKKMGDTNESTIDEISKDMKSRYINKAANDLSKNSIKFGVNVANPLKAPTPNMQTNKKKIDNRLQGIKKASEEVKEAAEKVGDNCSCCDNKIDEAGKCGCDSSCNHCGGQHNVSEGKAYGPTGVSYSVPSGHKDEVDPKTREKRPERQKPQGKTFFQGYNDRKNRGVVSKPIDKDKFFGNKKAKISEPTKEETIPNIVSKITNKHVKQGIGIARDKRYAGGNMTGATKVMDKIHPKLANHPRVQKELQTQNEDSVSDNKERYSKPIPVAKVTTGMQKQEPEMTQEVNLTSILTGENPFYRGIKERNIQFHTGHSAADVASHNKHQDTVKAIHKDAGAHVTKSKSGSPDKSGKSMQGLLTAKSKSSVQHVVDTIKRHIPKSAHGSIKVSEEAITEVHGTYSDNTHSDGKNISHHVDSAHDYHQKTKHAGVKFHTAMGDDSPHAVTVSKGSPALKDKKFMSHVKKLVKVNNEGHDEIQDKDADGKDDNQKPEGHLTAKQFDAPKDVKKKVKSLKMEMKTDIADYVLEKASIKKGDMKMRGGKLDPKAMAALKTMSAEDAKVMIQGLPTNLRRSTMKELGIKEVVDIRTQTYKETVTKLAKAKSLYHKMEAELPEASVEEMTTKAPNKTGPNNKGTNKGAAPIAKKTIRQPNLY